MRNAFAWSMWAKWFAGKFKQSEEIGLTSPHKVFVIFTYFGSIRDSYKGEMRQQLWSSAAMQWGHRIWASWEQDDQPCFWEMHFQSMWWIIRGNGNSFTVR